MVTAESGVRTGAGAGGVLVTLLLRPNRLDDLRFPKDFLAADRDDHRPNRHPLLLLNTSARFKLGLELRLKDVREGRKEAGKRKVWGLAYGGSALAAVPSHRSPIVQLQPEALSRPRQREPHPPLIIILAEKGLDGAGVAGLGGEVEGGCAAVVRLVGACGEEGIRDLAVPVHRRILHPQHNNS